jgi:hypothetical protein
MLEINRKEGKGREGRRGEGKKKKAKRILSL